jgi:hypothetical protein
LLKKITLRFQLNYLKAVERERQLREKVRFAEREIGFGVVINY